MNRLSRLCREWKEPFLGFLLLCGIFAGLFTIPMIVTWKDASAKEEARKVQLALQAKDASRDWVKVADIAVLHGDLRPSGLTNQQVLLKIAHSLCTKYPDEWGCFYYRGVLHKLDNHTAEATGDLKLALNLLDKNNLIDDTEKKWRSKLIQKKIYELEPE